MDLSRVELVGVSRRLTELPFLSARFACGDLSLDQVEAISRMAAPGTEQDLIEEALWLSNQGLDRKARTCASPSGDDERTIWERRRLVYARAGGRCQYPGRANRRWLPLHHKQHWADGSTTYLENFVSIRGFQRRFSHEHGRHITGPPERPTFRKPDWTIYPRPPDPLDPTLASLVCT